MKSLLLLLLLLLLILAFLNACSYSVTKDIVNQKTKLDESEPVYIYFDGYNNLPDSTEYVGTIEMEIQLEQLDAFYGFANNYTEELQEAGANLFLVEKITFRPRQNVQTAIGKMFKIPNPKTTNYTEESVRKMFDKLPKGTIEGIYETEYVDSLVLPENTKEYRTIAKYAIVQEAEDRYVIVYLSGFEGFMQEKLFFGTWDMPYGFAQLSKIWKTGDVMGYLYTNDKKNSFRAKVYEYNKFLYENAMAKNENGNLIITTPRGNDSYRKIFPESAVFESKVSSLTGFALSNNRIMTCYDAIAELDKNSTYRLYAIGIEGDFYTKHRVVLDKSDRANDIAVLKFVDETTSLNFIPFSFNNTQKELGEEVSVLGYPNAEIMGESLKISDGIISSTNGYGDNPNSYQISAAVQNGNQGSPLFDIDGNFVGIVTSRMLGADNVAYAIKSSIISDFFKNKNYNFQNGTIESNKKLNRNELSEKLKNSIYLLELNNADYSKRANPRIDSLYQQDN